VKSVVMGLPKGLVFRTKGQLAIDILAGVFAGGIRLDFVCGDEVYGSCTQLREICEDYGQAYVLRVPSSFRLTLAAARGSPWPARSGAGAPVTLRRFERLCHPAEVGRYLSFWAMRH
jgi:hypothetical protein